jgi:hypothetical protein
MGKVIHLDLNDSMLVLESLQEVASEIDEICVVYTMKDGTRRIIHSELKDPLSFYGIITGMAHNVILHEDGVPLSE